jgi:hypothetical protein
MEIENNGCIGHPVTNQLNEEAASRDAEREAKAKPEAKAPAAKKPAAKKPARKAK